VVTSTYNYNSFIAPISNGAFNVPVNICRDLPVAATVWVYDSVNNQSSNEYLITINSTNQNVGQIKTNGIATPPVAPVSGFSYSVGNTTLPVTVTFTNTSTNATTWLWNFGDGTSSTAQDPAHSYTTAGDFPVSLKATGAGGSDSILTVIHISGVADDSYINLALNGTTYSWAYPNIDAGHTDSNTVIYGTAPNLIYINILSNNTSPGNYNINLSATINGRSYLSNNATTTVTEYGSIGGNIIGTGSGQLADSTTSIPFTLAYKVKRNR
jgi:PKD repeat protein